MSDSLFKISGGYVYDPLNGIDGQARDIWIDGGRIVEAPTNPDVRPTRTLDAAGEEQQRLQGLLNDVRQVIAKYPLMAAVKQIEVWKSGDESWSKLFPPLVRLTQEQQTTLRSELEALPAECDVFNMQEAA